MIELDVLSPSARAADAAAQATAGQPQPWRSAADRDGLTADLHAAEFLPDAAGGDAETSRRTFLKVMGASAALAGLSGCRRPVEPILPYVRKSQEVIPGVPTYFATARPAGAVGHAVLVQSHEGRPTKVEGNPEHPVSQGASDAFAQASVLQLYDPDRSRHVWRRERTGADAAATDYGAFVAEAARLRVSGGRLVVLAPPSASAALADVRTRLLAASPGAQWITMPETVEDTAALGTQAAFGRPARPLYRFSEADVVVSFDADFLGTEDPGSVWNNREYAASRRVEGRPAGRAPMSRLYAAESTMTVTGGMADHRVALPAGRIPFFAAAVANALGVGTGTQPTLPRAAAEVAAAVAEDVRAAAGRAVFVAGPTQPPQVHALAAALNGRFGGQAVSYLDTGAEPVQPLGPQLQALVAAMNARQVGTLLCLGTNPVYTLPAALGFAEALERVPVSIHAGLYRDETGQRTTWHLPLAHYLEAWGDTRAYDGTRSVVQPLIAPLHADAHSEIEIVNTLATGRNNAGYDLVRRALADVAGDEDRWRTVLHDGFVADSAYPTLGAGGGAADLAALTPPADLPEDAVELVFRASPTLGCGEFSNVSWMQEQPHPVTKLTWDPVALMSRATAARLGVGMEERKGKVWADVVRFSAGDYSVTAPVWVQPGHPDDSVTVYLGYGRDLSSERVLEGWGVFDRLLNRDTDVYRPGPVAHLAGGGLDGGALSARAETLRPISRPPVLSAVRAERVGGDYLLASTQDHGSMEGRAIIRHATAAEYVANPTLFKEREHLIEDTPWEAYPPLWDDDSASQDPRIAQALYSDNQWGMTIDLNACTGCNACVVACQAENNVPVVGKDQVSRGREMHWLRLDRYYVGDEASPGMAVQPVMCQHCENAPCEQVCPVNATSHSPDGLNEMTYNRCVGTRYCSNNCPYKVRRYNFYNWTKTLPVEVQMQSNPYVTVRYRGVMEKCTFCVQRIRQTQQYAHINDAPLADGDVVTACQQACPAQAITFGDLRNAASAVAQSKQSPRNYALLGELSVKPRLTYLARLRNPNPRLAHLDPFAGEADGHHGGDGAATDHASAPRPGAPAHS